MPVRGEERSIPPSARERRARPEVRDPLDRAAAAARLLFPFDELWAVLHAGPHATADFAGSVAGGPAHLAFPPADVPSVPEGTVRVVGDLAAGGERRTPLVEELLRRGVQSALLAPLRGGDGRTIGSVGFGSKEPAAFSAALEAPAFAVAGLLAPALEGARAADSERDIRRHLGMLDRLLPTLATTLDIREVFLQLSEIVREIVPHEALGLQILQPDRKTIVAHVFTDKPTGEVWDYGISYALNENDMTDAIVDAVRFDSADGPAIITGRFYVEAAGPEGVPLSVALDPKRTRLVRQTGFRSYLRSVLRHGEEKIGALVFAASGENGFHRGQLEVAHRIADHVAMALAHRRLAEEAARAAESRARAAMLEDRVEELIREAAEREGLHRCVGESRAWKEVLTQATRVAPTETTVLLTGESGTGKEVVAHFIHRGSPRARGPLVAVNCAALPEQLLESELFGYERGAFSGALTSKPGRIEQAARGVLFFDEIGELSLALQAKLLRVLQEKEFQRLGGTRTLKADVRVVAATNRDLVAAMKRGAFREDLYYRLRVFEIRLPPLRERPEDVLPLTAALLADLEKGLGRRTAGLSREAREILLAYRWPGNVRELRNALERAVILCDGGLITGEQLPLGVGEPGREGGPALSSDMNLESVERDLIEKALRQAGNNKSRAARLLGLSRAQLYFRLEKYGFVEPPG